MKVNFNKQTDKIKSWKSKSSITIMCLIALIFIYIAFDSLVYRPKINKNLDELNAKYLELKGYVDKKIPEIDSTLKVHTAKLQEQRKELNKLNTELVEQSRKK